MAKARKGHKKRSRDPEQAHLEALRDRFTEFLREMYPVTDDTDIKDLGGDLSPVTPITIGDLKTLLLCVTTRLDAIEEAREKVSAAPAQVLQ